MYDCAFFFSFSISFSFPGDILVDWRCERSKVV